MTTNNRKPDFVPIRQLGRGFFGVVNLMEYHGNSPELAGFKGRTVVVKEFVGAPDNDVVIGPHLHRFKQANPSASFCSGVPFTSTDGKTRIMGDFVSYDKGPPPASSDLESYFRKLNQNDKHRQTVPLFNDENIGVTLSQLGVDLAQGQEGLHAAGVFHFDTAQRNSLVADVSGPVIKTKINDYGLSELIPPNGVINTAKQAPSISTDSRSLAGHGYTIAADLYARRITMMENVISALRINPTSIFNLNGATLPNDIVREKIKSADDNIALRSYYANLVNAANQCQNPKLRAQVMNYLQSHQEYLCRMPRGCQASVVNGVYQYPTYNADSMKEIRQRDMTRLQTATQTFNTNLTSITSNKSVLDRRINADLPASLQNNPEQQKFFDHQQQLYKNQAFLAKSLEELQNNPSQVKANELKTFAERLVRGANLQVQMAAQLNLPREQQEQAAKNLKAAQFQLSQVSAFTPTPKQQAAAPTGAQLAQHNPNKPSLLTTAITQFNNLDHKINKITELMNSQNFQEARNIMPDAKKDIAMLFKLTAQLKANQPSDSPRAKNAEKIENSVVKLSASLMQHEKVCSAVLNPVDPKRSNRH